MNESEEVCIALSHRSLPWVVLNGIRHTSIWYTMQGKFITSQGHSSALFPNNSCCSRFLTSSSGLVCVLDYRNDWEVKINVGNPVLNIWKNLDVFGTLPFFERASYFMHADDTGYMIGILTRSNDLFYFTEYDSNIGRLISGSPFSFQKSKDCKPSERAWLFSMDGCLIGYDPILRTWHRMFIIWPSVLEVIPDSKEIYCTPSKVFNYCKNRYINPKAVCIYEGYAEMQVWEVEWSNTPLEWKLIHLKTCKKHYRSSYWTIELVGDYILWIESPGESIPNAYTPVYLTVLDLARQNWVTYPILENLCSIYGFIPSALCP